MFTDPQAGGNNAVAVETTDNVIHTMAEGLGFNWHVSLPESDIFPKQEEEERWQRIFEHADWLNINFVRLGLSPRDAADDTGAFAPKPGEAWKRLARINEWAERRGVNLIIDPFSVPGPFRYKVWDGAPVVWGQEGSYSLGVEDVDGYVSRFAVPYVRHVVEEMGCKSVRWFNHVNEPLRGGAYATPPGVDDHVRYVEVLKAIRQGLDEAGLSAIGNMGPDTHTHCYWPIPHMVEMGADPDPYIEAYCMHHYHSHFDWDAPAVYLGQAGTEPISRTIEEQVNKYCAYAHDRGKPYLVTELGMFQYGWASNDPAGMARHDNIVLELEFMVRALNRGVDGILRWIWMDTGDRDGWWQLITTTDGSDEPLPTSYYGYATLYRHIDRQAKVLGTRVSFPKDAPPAVHAVTVENPDGSRSLCIINDAYACSAKITVRFRAPGSSTIRKIVCDPVRKYDEQKSPATLSGGEAEWADELSPLSLTVYTTKPAEQGIGASR